jgi:dethiobiotin synthetase
MKSCPKFRISKVLIVALASGLMNACVITESSIQPTGTNPALAQELATYLEPDFGDNLTVEYELLRDIPTQVGVAVPKYYVWLIATEGDAVLVEGAARVAAEDAETFTVLNFVSQQSIQENPDQLDSIFPTALIPAIETRAGLERED